MTKPNGEDKLKETGSGGVPVQTTETPELSDEELENVAGGGAGDITGTNTRGAGNDVSGGGGGGGGGGPLTAQPARELNFRKRSGGD